MDEASILISSFNGGIAIELCIESIKKRTLYFPYKIIVLDSSPESSNNRQYLKEMATKGVIELIEYSHQLKHGEAIYQLFGYCNSQIGILLDSDIEILRPDWIDVLVGYLKTEKDLGVGNMRLPCNFPKTKIFRCPSYHPCCFALNIDAYNEFGIRENDWKERFVPMSEYKDKAFFDALNPNMKKVHYETGSGFTERVLFFNEKNFVVHALPNKFIANAAQEPAMPHYVKHYEGISALNYIYTEKMKRRRQLIAERLRILRKE